jgi:hypothetical protein
MAEKTKKAFLILMIVFTLAAVSGCATASVGLGYHVPITDRIGTGIYFGVGF